MKKYKACLIGCGGRGRQHSIGYQFEERINLTGICDIKPEAMKFVNKEYGFNAKEYLDYKEMLEIEKPEIVSICLWTPLHMPVFKDCINAGVKNIISEKPIAPTYRECKEMIKIAKENDCQLTFSHQRRFAEGNMAVRKMIKDGVFGDIKRLDLYSPPNLLDCGTHTLDQAFSFLGEINVKWVLGTVDYTENINWFSVPSEKLMIGTLVYENGIRANIQVGGEDKDMDTGVRVIGSKGFIDVTWEGLYTDFAVYDNPNWLPPDVKENKEEQMRKVISNAVDSMETGDMPELDASKAIHSAEVIFAFYESMRSRKRINLPLENTEDNPFITMLENDEF